MILLEATGMGVPDPLFQALMYEVDMGVVLLEGTGPGCLWEKEEGDFNYQSRIIGFK